MSDRNYLEVGDTLVATTSMGSTYKYPITRVTKTLAMSLRPVGDFEYKFKRTISDNMRHPHRDFDLSTYKVIYKADKEVVKNEV